MLYYQTLRRLRIIHTYKTLFIPIRPILILYVFILRIIHTYTTPSFLVFKNYYRDLMAASPRQNSKLFWSVQ